MNRLARELEIAMQAAQKAGDEILRQYATFERLETAPANISTEADRASQEIILGILTKEFPEDGIIAEEATESLKHVSKNLQRHWVVDPIDGTRGYALKLGEFSVMIALVENEEVVLGVVAEPAIERITYACRGEGCFVKRSREGTPRKCTVTTCDRLDRAILSISRSQGVAGERKLLDGFGAGVTMQSYSAGIKLAQVARGESDIYLGDYLTLRDWDICAGQILVEEAGGTMTTTDGKVIRYKGNGTAIEKRGLIATNGKLHSAALEVLSSGRYRFS